MKTCLKIIFLCLFIFASSVFAQESIMFDKFEDIQCEDYLQRTDNFLVRSNNEPTSKFYIFVYEGRLKNYKRDNNYKLIGNEYLLPPFGLAKAKISSMKKLIAYKNIPQKRFIFVNAGFRENFAVEFWIVPNGVTPPSPTPTLRKIRYRKGKAFGFCLECCGP